MKLADTSTARSMFLFLLLLSNPDGVTAQEVQAFWVDSTATRGILQEFTDRELTISEDGVQKVRESSQLRIITFDSDPEFSRAGQVLAEITLVNDDLIHGADVRLVDEMVQFESPIFGTVSLPVESVRGVKFPGNGAISTVPEPASTGQEGDLIRLRNGDAVRGTTLSMNGQELVIETSLGKIQIPRENIAAIRFDPTLLMKPELEAIYQIAEFQEGSWLTCSTVTIHPSGECRLHHLLDVDLTARSSSLRKISCYSETIESLSSRTPLSSEGQSFFGRPLTVEENFNYLNGQLVTGGERFCRGLGMTSRTVVTYAVEPGDQFLQVQTGLDDSAGPKGSLEMRIEVDGRVAWSGGTITLETGLITVPPIPLSGGREFSLVVDFGPGADVQDLANWCDPVVIRQPK